MFRGLAFFLMATEVFSPSPPSSVSTMKLLVAPLITHLLALGTRPKTSTTWFIDGNNLLGHRGTPKDPDTLAQKLQPIRGAEAVILVLDGRPGAETSTETTGAFQRVNLGEGSSADDYILGEIRARNRPNAPRQEQSTRVQVVTADRKLRKAVLGIKPIVKDVVNPVTFWRRYLPRLCGYKLPKRAPAQENEG